jgi:uncharacterized protein (TIGR00369 family)
MQTRNPDYRSDVQQILQVAPFIQDLGLRLADVGPGYCETELILSPKHRQQDGYVHAEVLATVADHSAGCAGASLVAANEYVLTAEFNISFLHAAQGERLRCRAEVIKPGRRLSVVESAVYAFTGGDSTMVAKARVTLAVLERPDESKISS